MNILKNTWLSLAAPLLILLALMGYIQRSGKDKVQSLPALFIGVAIISTNSFRFQRRRKKLFLAMKNNFKNEI